MPQLTVTTQTTFTDIVNTFGSERSLTHDKGQHLRFDGTQLYTSKTKLSSAGLSDTFTGTQRLQDRADKQAKGWDQVKQAIEREYGGGTLAAALDSIQD